MKLYNLNMGTHVNLHTGTLQNVLWEAAREQLTVYEFFKPDLTVRDGRPLQLGVALGNALRTGLSNALMSRMLLVNTK